MNSLSKVPAARAFREILAHVPADESAASVIVSSVSIASLFAAHIDAIAAVEQFDGRDGAPDAGPGWLETIATFEDALGAAAGSLLQFEAAAREAGLSYGKRLIADGANSVDQMLLCASRLYDVCIAAQPGRAAASNTQLKAMLFDSGRPVILVPHTHRGGIALDHVAICWDGGRYAARAVHDAMPLLEMAGCIDIIAVNELRESAVPSSDALASHLHRRRLNIRTRQLTSEHPHIHRAIMSVAIEAECKLLVMGGYGHSKAGRFVLGGVTRDALEEMSIPTFISF